MCVLGDDRGELFYGLHFRDRFIAVPLEVAALPEHAPQATRSDKGRLGDSSLMLLAALSAPGRAKLKYLDTLAGNGVPKIQLGANVWRRPTLLNEGIHRFCALAQARSLRGP